MPRLPNAPLFPMFMKLEGRRCVVVGAGRVAEAKIKALLPTGALVHVVAPRASAAVRAWTERGTLTWTRRRFVAGDVDDAALVIAATSSRKANQAVFDAATAKRVPCNAVDDPERCDFYFPAVVRRGPLQIAISTGGCSPALARRLRLELEKRFAAEYSVWVSRLGERRREMMSCTTSPSRRRRALQRLARLRPFEVAHRDRGMRQR